MFLTVDASGPEAERARPIAIRKSDAVCTPTTHRAPGTRPHDRIQARDTRATSHRRHTLTDHPPHTTPAPPPKLIGVSCFNKFTSHKLQLVELSYNPVDSRSLL